MGLLRTCNTGLCYVAGATEFTAVPRCLSVSLFIGVYLAGLVCHGHHMGQCCRNSPEEAGGGASKPPAGTAPEARAGSEQRVGTEWGWQLRKGEQEAAGAGQAKAWREDHA